MKACLATVKIAISGEQHIDCAVFPKCLHSPPLEGTMPLPFFAFLSARSRLWTPTL